MVEYAYMEREGPGLVEKTAYTARNAGLLFVVAMTYFGFLGLAVSVGFISAAIHAGAESLKRQRLKTA